VLAEALSYSVHLYFCSQCHAMLALMYPTTWPCKAHRNLFSWRTLQCLHELDIGSPSPSTLPLALNNCIATLTSGQLATCIEPPFYLDAFKCDSHTHTNGMQRFAAVMHIVIKLTHSHP
jgi:hypothetical protein